MHRTITVAAVAEGALALPGVAAARQNPWFPLHPGDRWVYAGTDTGHVSRDVVRVTHRTITIQGVRCRVVSDKVFLDGRLSERTHDYYATSRHRVVRYYGEDTAELDRHGKVRSTEGTWRAGRDGGVAGVIMPAHPRRGQRFRQEYLKGVAEDHFRVLTRHATISTPYGTFVDNALKTAEWSPLEPGVHDRKWYARGIGQVAEATVKGGSESLRLVSFTKG